MLVLETLGTGTEQPEAPTASLDAYYQWLEGERGFAREVIQTDYEFASVEDAALLAGFFFGDGLAKQVQRNRGRIVAEWTGVWTKRV